MYEYEVSPRAVRVVVAFDESTSFMQDPRISANKNRTNITHLIRLRYSRCKFVHRISFYLGLLDILVEQVEGGYYPCEAPAEVTRASRNRVKMFVKRAQHFVARTATRASETVLRSTNDTIVGSFTNHYVDFLSRVCFMDSNRRIKDQEKGNISNIDEKGSHVYRRTMVSPDRSI